MDFQVGAFNISTNGSSMPTVSVDTGNGTSVGINDGKLEIKNSNGDVSFGVDSLSGSAYGNKFEITTRAC